MGKVREESQLRWKEKRVTKRIQETRREKKKYRRRLRTSWEVNVKEKS